MKKLQIACVFDPPSKTTCLSFHHLDDKSKCVKSTASNSPTPSTLKRISYLIFRNIGQPGFRIEPALNGIGWYAYIDKE